jgi:D-amino peptidase
MRVYLSADIEGCTGLVSWSQCGRPNSSYYDFAFARRMMTHDVNAAIRAVKAMGGSVVVKDSHGNSKNLLIDELEPETELISGHGAGADGMMMGIGDEPFDAALLIGYHARAGAKGAIMEHTITGGIHRLRINGVEHGEIGLAMGVAALYSVPVVAISSDAAGCDEFTAYKTGGAAAETKVGYGRYMGKLWHPKDTSEVIFQAVQAGLKNRSKVKLFPIDGPHVVEIEFNRQEEANTVAKLQGFTQVDGYTVRAERRNFREAHTAIWNAVAMSGAGADSGN